MNAEMLAANIVAHWVQAGVVAAASLLAIRLLDVRAPGYRLVVLQLTLLTSLLLPVMQPYAVEEQPQLGGAWRLTLPACRTNSLTLRWFRQPRNVHSPIDPAQALLLIVVAGVALRLAWLTYGVIRLARFSRHATEVAPPPAAAALEAEIGVSPRYILQTGNRGPWTFGLFRPTVALPVTIRCARARVSARGHLPRAAAHQAPRHHGRARRRARRRNLVVSSVGLAVARAHPRRTRAGR